MSNINVFLQGEGIKEVLRIQTEPQSTILDVKHACAAQGVPTADETVVFAEDEDEPLPDTATMGSLSGKHGARLHFHRCRRIGIKVTYSGRVVGASFGPGRTVGAVKRWAAQELGIGKEDTVELILQLAGTHEQPDVDVHIGTLAECPACAIAFDLVPNPRIQGAA